MNIWVIIYLVIGVFYSYSYYKRAYHTLFMYIIIAILWPLVFTLETEF